MADVNRERDLVLAPNEYAYISDQTKGHVIAYVGPYKTSLANTDKPVTFDGNSKRFKLCSLEEAIVNFATAPEGWYIILKNPSKDGNQPKIGTSNNLPELEIGRKVNLPGPVFFALWPGQMSRIVPGHHLRSNQYLLVRVYDEEQARKNWNKAVIKVKNEEGEDVPKNDIPDLTMGQQLIIKGTNVSFYIPPTGIEVVRDAHENYVREAVTLERLEYCILLDESGNKRYIIGPDVVFPHPTETFITKDGSRKYKAIELNDISGIYVKVIAPYEENGKRFNVGDELFITGKDQMIYYPRVEHALIKYGDQEIYHSVAIPAGQGRYVLNRKTGKISLSKGPTMLLPDPRDYVLVRRILSAKQVELCFPGNQEALQYNMMLSQLAKEEQQQEYLQVQKLEKKKDISQRIAPAPAQSFVSGDEFTRNQNYTPPRMITLTDKYDGAVTINVWAGYASLIVSKTGERKVIVGPNTYLLEYDEELQPIEFSTGTPKTDNNLMRSVYLRVLHNKVSDKIVIETKDFCKVEIKLSYRMNFTGAPEKWFDVENYVKFLTDHMRSVLANAIQKIPVADFYFNSIAFLRDVVLGVAGENARRLGRKFEENGMHIYDVEILEVALLDDMIEEAILESQHEGVQKQVRLTSALQNKAFTDQNEEIERHIARTKSLTKQILADMMLEELQKQHKVAVTKIQAAQIESLEALKSKLSEQDFLKQIQESEVLRKKTEQEAQLAFNDKILEQKLRELKAEVDAAVAKAGAYSPDLIAALQAFGDKALAEKMAESMAPLSILGGKSVAEVFSNLLKGTNLENILKIGGKE